MKRIFGILILSAIFALTINANAADTLRIGEIEPCDSGILPGCNWLGAGLFLTNLDDYPDCIIGVEYYYKYCFNNLEIQIVRTFLMSHQYTTTEEACEECVDLSSNQTYFELFTKLFVTKANAIKNEGGSISSYMTSRKSCTKYVRIADFPAPSMFVLSISPETLILTPDTLQPYSSLTAPLFPQNMGNDPFVYAYTVVCNSDCCCFPLEVNWNPDNIYELQSISTGVSPCLNVSYECPTGCNGGCSDLEFYWSQSLGYISTGKFPALDFNNSIHSEITISPNPNRGTFDFKISSETIGTLNIVITDILGNEIYNKSNNKSNTEFTSQLKLDLSQGEYFIYFTIDGKYAGLRKIVINK